MYKKVVMWKIQSVDNGVSRRKLALTIKSMLDKLPEIIHVIITLEVGVNTNLSNEYFNLVLIGEFDNYEDMIIFQEHQEYQKIDQYMKPLIMDTKVVEYVI